MGKLKKTTSILLVFALLFTFSFPFNNKHVVAKTSSSKTQPEQTSSSENNNEKEISKVRIESLDNNDKDLYVEVENLKDKVIVTSYLGDKKIDQSGVRTFSWTNTARQPRHTGILAGFFLLKNFFFA
ncbi:MAG: hypothetical protein LKI80_16720, partial [Sporolactobacillus sp.]|nr:hypothetical protein [Sporolactobacillus sp.]